VVITDLNMERNDIGLDVARAAQKLKATSAGGDLHGIREHRKFGPGLGDASGLPGHETGGSDELKQALMLMLSASALQRRTGREIRRRWPMVKTRKDELPRLALLVHPNVSFLTGLQHSFEAKGVHSVVARDLRLLWLALNQHDFGMAVIHSRIMEEGDGWALAGVVRRMFGERMLR